MNSDDSVSLMKLPSPWAGQLLDGLTREEDYKTWPKGSKLSFQINGEPVCHFVRSGVMTLERFDDALLMGTVTAPLALGWMSATSSRMILRAKGPCEIATIPFEQVMALVEQKQLWDLVAKHMLHITNKLFIYNEILTAPTTYDLICYQLISLLQEPESTRNSTAAYQYILDRTRLSRSSVMKMLAELKKGGYIQLEQGKLVAIHYLPPGF
ncbi:Crp/Fnr family transcriptional regulator [Atlantibacter subterranea]|uniref:Crp/Fnr family transcriptional regulator n=2 Tax=Enterobacteriaceae TaxID=543 RepID=A0A3R9F044_9ENTR|nr:Crp/Fnr family transcriptional regulator [Atlantibacter subterranea]RSE04371.1 Crp/Fnr family transcriptional regulator [Atlantibacter subterranea]RSE25604.1 Crp/Fnr family transcriptional regulator [Atlantibacter subterranea]